jgi:hypothetical protein
MPELSGRDCITNVWFEQPEVNLLALQGVPAVNLDEEALFPMSFTHISGVPHQVWHSAP